MGQLTDTQLKRAKPRAKAYELADGDGLIAEVMPTGTIAWRYRYRLEGRREKVSIGKYPAVSLAKARAKGADFAVMIADGKSPMREKREKRIARKTPHILQDFARSWLRDVVEKTRQDAKQIKRYLEKDVFPTLGNKRLSDVTPADVLAITDRIKRRGAEQSALLVRNIVKRLYAYAIARQVATSNPAEALEARHIAQTKSRERVLSRDEVGQLIRAVNRSSMRTSNKAALSLLLITMVRKTELTGARWENVNLETGEWEIPDTKTGKPHLVYLSAQAKALFEELKALAGDSPFVLPSDRRSTQPIAESTLNVAVRGLKLSNFKPFVVHDFRRTASTHLHEAGFSSDVIEKALAHHIGGVRGIYNRAEYASQRKEMLQQWANMVDAWKAGTEIVPILRRA